MSLRQKTRPGLGLRPRANGRRLPGSWPQAVAVALLLALPTVVGGTQLGLPTDICIYAIFALNYDLVFGFVGLISFGQALFVGAGAYALTISMTGHGLSLALALLVSLLTGVILATVTGLLALRTRGISFAMVTLAFAQAAFTLAESDMGNLTGGDNGMQVSGAPDWLVGPGNASHLYYVTVAALAVCYLGLRRVVGSPAGSVWQAIRENERRALLLGYRPYRYKLLAYVIAGAISALAGSLYALWVGAVSPNLLATDLTIQLLLMVIIGGAGSLWGAVVGAAIIRALNHYLNLLSTADAVAHLPGWLSNTLGQPLLILGCIYLFAVYFFPSGIAGLSRTLLHRPAIMLTAPPRALGAQGERMEREGDC